MASILWELIGLFLKHCRKNLGTYLGLVVSALCVLSLFKLVDKDKVLSELGSANYALCALALLTVALSYFLRSLRWPFFLDRGLLSFWSSFYCLVIGFLMNNLLPARAGELLRAHYGGRITGRSRFYILATIAVERLADGLSISAIFVVAYCISSQLAAASPSGELLLVSLLFFVASLLSYVLVLFRSRIQSLLNSLGGRFALASYSAEKVAFFLDGLGGLATARSFLAALPLSLFIWSVELCVCYELCLAFSSPPSLAKVAIFLAAVNFSSLIPSAPGAIGVIEFFGSYSLVQLGVEESKAFAMVSVHHAIQMAVVGLFGSLAFLRFKGFSPSST